MSRTVKGHNLCWHRRIGPESRHPASVINSAPRPLASDPEPARLFLWLKAGGFHLSCYLRSCINGSPPPHALQRPPPPPPTAATMARASIALAFVACLAMAAAVQGEQPTAAMLLHPRLAAAAACRHSGHLRSGVCARAAAACRRRASMHERYSLWQRLRPLTSLLPIHRPLPEGRRDPHAPAPPDGELHARDRSPCGPWVAVLPPHASAMWLTRIQTDQNPGCAWPAQVAVRVLHHCV